MATLCPCIVFGQTVGRLDPADVPLGGNKWGATLVYSLCPSVAAVSTRAGIRRKYNLRGSLLEDCLTSLGCGCCALIQVLHAHRVTSSESPCQRRRQGTGGAL